MVIPEEVWSKAGKEVGNHQSDEQKKEQILALLKELYPKAIRAEEIVERLYDPPTPVVEADGIAGQLHLRRIDSTMDRLLGLVDDGKVEMKMVGGSSASSSRAAFRYKKEKQ